jgi:hypothetical protein
MVVIVGQALIHLRALQVGEAAADLIHAGAVDDQTDDVVDANPGAFHSKTTRIQPRS